LIAAASAHGHANPALLTTGELMAYVEEHEPGGSDRVLREGCLPEEISDEQVLRFRADERAMNEIAAELGQQP